MSVATTVEPHPVDGPDVAPTRLCLRPGVLALPTPAGMSFLAPAMGAGASLVVEGPPALHALWGLVAESWQEGAEAAALDELAVPEGARRVLASWWQELSGRGLLVPTDRLLCRPGDPVDSDRERTRRRLDASAPDPAAAWAALARAQVDVVVPEGQGPDALLARSLARALGGGGVGTVRLVPTRADVATGPRLLVDTTGRRPEADLAVLGDLVVVADPARGADDHQLGRVLAAVRTRPAAPTTDAAAASTVQLALAVSLLAQRTVGMLAGTRDQHAGEVALVKDLGPVVAYARPAPHDPADDGLDVDALLDGAHWLTDLELGPLSVAEPGDLEQVPVPLAHGRAHPGDVLLGGSGTTAREARVDVLLGQLSALAGEPDQGTTGSALARGVDEDSLRADALTRLALQATDPGTPLAPARVVAPDGREAHLPVHLATVRADGSVIGAACDADPDRARTRALDRAEGVRALRQVDVDGRTPLADPVAPAPSATWVPVALDALDAAGLRLRLRPVARDGHPLPGVAVAVLDSAGVER